MKKIDFTLYGIWIGAKYATLGSVLFSILAFPLSFLTLSILEGENFFEGLDLRGMVTILGMFIMYCMLFSILPGMIGGAAMARWLESAKRTTSEIFRRGISVGALCGFFASLFYLIGFILSSFYGFGIGLELLAIFIAAWMGLLGMTNLSKELESRI